MTYSLGDAAGIRGRTVLVVGGGNGALEDAAELADPLLANTVVISCRGSAFARATSANRERIAALERTGRLTVLWSSHVLRIAPRGVEIEADGAVTSVPAEKVIVMIGGELPRTFLADLGVAVDVKFGTD